LHDSRDGASAPATGKALSVVYGEARIPLEGTGHDASDGRQQSGEVGMGQGRCGRPWIDPRAPERFDRVNVPDPSDQGLIEQRGLDRAAATAEGAREVFGTERRIGCFGSKMEIDWSRRFAEVDCRQGTWIDEPEPRAIVELEDGTGEARRRVRGATYQPITGHSKVRVHGASVVQVQELVLPAPFDTFHPSAGEGSQARGGDARAKAAVHQTCAHDRASLCC
jgi:hypothetical protein